MPQTIKPIIDTSAGGHSYNLNPGGDWGWLSKQAPTSDQLTGNYARGAALGGPTFHQFLADDPKKFTVLASPPPLTSAILGKDTNGNGGLKPGQLSLDLIDPFGTMAEATGSFVGNDQPVAGTNAPTFDPGRFLAGKGIDLFGQGDAGVPARLADYALALPIAVLNKMNGVTSAEPSANNGLKYRFQSDPGYWTLLDAAKTDDQLRAIASSVAARYVDPARNGALVQQLFDQFKSDRDTALTAISSGNDRIDYIAKWRYAADVAAAQAAPDTAAGNGFSERNLRSSAIGISTVSAEFLSAIPFVGSQLAAGIAPVDVIDPMWNALTPEQRRGYFTDAGFATTALDFAVQLPLLSGFGSALAIAKGSSGIAGTLYKAYDTGLRAASVMMGSGLAIAAGNWALEAASPWYSDILGQEIDRVRPVSKSSLAGVVNEVGFWASGSFGVVPAIQVVSRVESKVAELVGIGLGKAHLPHVTIGTPELSFFRDGYGGSDVRNELAGAGVTGVETSIKASFLSHLMNYVEKVRREPLDAALRGEATPFAEVNAMGPEERAAWVNDQLARGMQDGPGAAEGLVRVLAYARRPRPILPSEEGRAAWDAAAHVGKTLDEQLTADVGRVYGPDFIASKRVVGTYQAKEMELWARKKTDELGGDGSKLGNHDAAGWEKIIRTLHQHEYHTLNGELDAAIEHEASGEAGKLALVASDHIFRNDAATLLAEIKAADGLARQELIANAIRTRREAATWFTEHYKPKAGHQKTPAAVSPDAFATWLEDAMPTLPTRRLNAAPGAATALDPINAFQDKVDHAGTWTLAFKPVDADGNLVSYVRTRNGGIMRSPWVEYPLTAGDNITLGNRGMLASKLDSLTRGFRTRRLTEFQRGEMFRLVTAKANVLPEQIDAFHEGILKLAHDSRVQPQTIGAVSRLPEVAFSIETKKKIDALAEGIFGTGDLPGIDGKTVHMDWPSVIQKAYRQSFKLNLTAGLTSWLKTMGPVGGAAAVASDIIYTAWRFGFSPLFKGGELLESAQLNGMRGVFRRDPTTEALFMRGGLGNDGSLISSELNFDSMTQALTGKGDWTPTQRMAASLSLHARHLPEDLQLTRETASTQAAADEVVAHHQAFDDAIAMLQRDGEATDPDTGDLLHPADDHQLANTIADLEQRGAAAAAAKPDLPPIADTTDELLRQLHMTLAKEPSEEGGLLSELDQIVGENGVHPGLEARAKEILDRLDEIERNKGDDGPVMAFADLSPARQADLRQRMFDVGDLSANPAPAELESAYARWQRRPANSDTIDEIAGTPEALFENILPAYAEAQIKKGVKGDLRQALETFWHPTNYKQGQALALQTKFMRDSFPGLLRASGNHGLVQVFEQLGIPEVKWADWLLEDRKLLDGWLNTKDPAELGKLLDHAGGDPAERQAFNDLYASPEWQTLTSLWAINLQATRDEAFGVHFFSPYRSAFERSINHPVLGIYPASWTIKAAREWAKFMFDNRTFGELRLGMAPAQAIASVVRSQAATWAETHPDTLDHFLNKGPLGSTIFIFNLLMPGDWSSLPFPLSRSIREVIRGDTNPAKILAANLDFLGATRDGQLIAESLGELQSIIFGKPHKDPVRLLTGVSAKGVDGQFSEDGR